MRARYDCHGHVVARPMHRDRFDRHALRLRRSARIDTQIRRNTPNPVPQRLVKHGLQQINTAVGEMDGVTPQNAAMVEQATPAARQLSNEAASLARQVAHFRVGTPANHRAGPSNQHGDRGVSHSVSNPVHDLLQRVATAGRHRASRPAGTTAVAFADDDWSAF